MKKLNLFAVAMAILLFPVMGFASEWAIDPMHSAIQFKVRHMMISNVRGSFNKFEGKVTTDEKEAANSKVEATIDVSSIDTGVEKRDEHLRSADFFDVEKFPKMTYVSKSAKKADNGKYLITGDLTMHGVTKEVVLEMEEPSPEMKDPQGKIRRGGSIFAKLNRKDFGLTYNKVLETGGVAVGEEIEIFIDVEVVKQEAAK